MRITTDMLVLCYEIDHDWKFCSEKHLTRLKYPYIMTLTLVV